MSEKNLDYKKEFKALYPPPGKPVLVTVPAMHFIMVDGTGDPNGNQGVPTGGGTALRLIFHDKNE